MDEVLKPHVVLVHVNSTVLSIDKDDQLSSSPILRESSSNVEIKCVTVHLDEEATRIPTYEIVNPLSSLHKKYFDNIK